MGNRKGFTLIELLVVIAIIALLMSILMPALAEVRKQARTMLCKTRLSNLNKFAYLYAADNDGLFWMGAGAKLGGAHLLDPHDMWPGACGKYATDGSDLNGYVEQRKIFLCPEATKPQMDPPWTSGSPGDTHWPANTTVTAWGSIAVNNNDQWAEPNFYSSYGDNASLSSLHPKANNWQWDGDPEVMRRQHWQTFDLKKASEIPMFMDAAWVGVGADNNNIPPSYEGEPILDLGEEAQMYNVCLNRHKQAVNICYVDGHCGTVALKQLWYQRWKRTSHMDGRGLPNWNKEAEWMEHFRRE